MKQIRNSELIERIIDRGDGYFHWLEKKSGLSGPLATMLADTEFVSVDGLDDILKEKAKEETRQAYAEEVCDDDEKIDTVYKSVRGDCCLFEVIVCLAVEISGMFEDEEVHNAAYFFEILLDNAGFMKYDEEDWDMMPEKVKDYWQKCIDRVLGRGYSEVGAMGFFPCTAPGKLVLGDQRKKSLWTQMNDWLDQHTNEDGDWVD